MSRTKFSLCFTSLANDLTTAQKRELKEALSAKINKIVKAGKYEVKPSAVKLERPVAAVEKPEVKPVRKPKPVVAVKPVVWVKAVVKPVRKPKPVVEVKPEVKPVRKPKPAVEVKIRG